MSMIAVLFLNSVAIGNVMWKAEAGGGKDNNQQFKDDVKAALGQMKGPDPISGMFWAISWPPPAGQNPLMYRCWATRVGRTDSNVFVVLDSCADKLKGNKMAVAFPQSPTVSDRLTSLPELTASYPVLKVYQGYKQGVVRVTNYAFLEVDKTVNLNNLGDHPYSTEYTKYSNSKGVRPSYP